MNFSVTGHNPDDLWLVDGRPDFSVLPPGVIPDLGLLPIWLKVGTPAYGYSHIQHKHRLWVAAQNLTVPELLYRKLGQAGSIYSTEYHGKIKIGLRIAPAALIVLELFSKSTQPHLSVTSMYGYPRQLDGQLLGRYPGRT